jgi:pimeloyl-ACP methyl ester carboxylesterase
MKESNQKSEIFSGLRVVLLHGLGETSAVWNKVSEYLREVGVTVLTPDLPGAGTARHYAASQLESLDFFAREIIHHTEEKPAVWIGHSMGGYVALAIGRLRPDLVRGLMLFHSTPEADSEEKRLKREQSIRIYTQNPTLFLQEFYRNLFAEPDKHQELLKTLMEYGLSLNPDHFIATLRALRDRPDSTAIFVRMPIPKALLAGKHDAVLPYERLKYLSEICQDRFYTAERSGHMAMYEEPDVTLRAVLDFLKICKTNQ